MLHLYEPNRERSLENGELMVMMMVDCDDGSTGGDLITCIYSALYLSLFIKSLFIIHRNRSLRLSSIISAMILEDTES